MIIVDKSLESKISYSHSKYDGKVMKDGKVFSASIHRRFLPNQYLSMVRGGYLLPASPLKFTWAIRRWLGLETSNLIRMKKTPSLINEYKIRASLLGKDIFNYIMNEERRKESLIFGRAVARRDGWEWVYLVPEEWIYDNMDELYKSYLAMGCYYTITSLQAFGKLNKPLEGVSKNGKVITIFISGDDSDGNDESLSMTRALREDKLFRESLSIDCLNKLNISTRDLICYNLVYLKNEEGAIEKFREFYVQECNTRKVTKELLDKYGVPVVSYNSPESENLRCLYVD